MTRNWSPQEVVSKDCRDKCGTRLYLNPINHKFFEDPELTKSHHCPNWQPRSNLTDIEEILRKVHLIEHKTEKAFALLSEINLHLKKMEDSKIE